MDDLKPLFQTLQRDWAKSFCVCSSNEIIRLKIPFCSGSKRSVRFFIKTPSLLLGWLSLINSQCLSQQLCVWLALIAPSFKGLTWLKGAFGEARGVKFTTDPCGTFSSVPVSAFLKCVCLLTSVRELDISGSLPWQCGCSSVCPEVDI